jgi:predicted Zn finger-like uncharacterized protein
MPASERLITTCPVGCGARFEVSDVDLPEGRLLRCSACGQLVSQISETAYRASMQAFDSPEFDRPSPAEVERRRGTAARRLTRIGKLLDTTATRLKLLDVGCSRGDFVAAAADLGLHAEGVEPAAHIAEGARRAGRTVHTGQLEEQRFPAHSFDAVTLFEVIEHLKEPIALLRECHRILRPGGVLLLSTGNGESWTADAMKGRWDYFQIERDAGHVSFFNPRSITLLARRTGFSVARLRSSRVKLLAKGQALLPAYLLAKLAAEALNLPAGVLGKGHDMLVYLRRQDD